MVRAGKGRYRQNRGRSVHGPAQVPGAIHVPAVPRIDQLPNTTMLRCALTLLYRQTEYRKFLSPKKAIVPPSTLHGSGLYPYTTRVLLKRVFSNDLGRC